MMNFRLAGEKIAAGDVDGDALFPQRGARALFREVIARAQKRRREESRRGTHECVRHLAAKNIGSDFSLNKTVQPST